MHISGSATRLAVETVSCCATNGSSLPMSLSAWCLANWRLPMATTWLVSRKRAKKTPVGQHPMLLDVPGHEGQLGRSWRMCRRNWSWCRPDGRFAQVNFQPRSESEAAYITPAINTHQTGSLNPPRSKMYSGSVRGSGPWTPQNTIYHGHIAGGGDFSSGTFLKGSTKTRPGHRESSAPSARISRALPPVVVNRENGNWQEVLHF